MSPSNEIPRKCKLELMSPGELAIHEAKQIVEAMGCDERLTDAIVLLIQAQDKVADFVDNLRRDPE